MTRIVVVLGISKKLLVGGGGFEVYGFVNFKEKKRLKRHNYKY